MVRLSPRWTGTPGIPLRCAYYGMPAGRKQSGKRRHSSEACGISLLPPIVSRRRRRQASILSAVALLSTRRGRSLSVTRSPALGSRYGTVVVGGTHFCTFAGTVPRGPLRAFWACAAVAFMGSCKARVPIPRSTVWVWGCFRGLADVQSVTVTSCIAFCPY
jgi:hypothetical protein